MSVLLVLIPPRPRGLARSAETAAPAAAEWSWVLSPDGLSVAAQGHGAPESWPRADSLSAVLADGDVGWQRITLPKAPAARLLQALHGVLEEQLLDDETALHFALPPDAASGKPTWVAVTQRTWLADQIARIEAGGRSVDRVLPPALPGAEASGHFASAPGDGPELRALQLSWADADGVALLGLTGSLARTRVAAAGDRTLRWTATPSAAAAAEAWLGQPVQVLGEAERSLIAARSGWNLRQFGLAPRHRGATALREALRQFLGPAWRPVRYGLLALVLVQLAGLNAWAWQERQALENKRQAMVALLQSTHPQVRAVLDAPLQMARETEALRTAAGEPGADDLETLLGVAAVAWPDDDEVATSLRFEPGRLTLGVPGWDAERLAAMRDQLQPAGWAVQTAEGTLTIARAPEQRP